MLLLVLVVVVLGLGGSDRDVGLWWSLSLVGDDAEALRRKLSEVQHRMAEIEKEKKGIGYIDVTVWHGPYEHGAGYPYNDYSDQERRLSDPNRYRALDEKYDRLSNRARKLRSKLDGNSAK